MNRFEPRNPAVAKTVLFVLSWVACGVTIVFAVTAAQQYRVAPAVTIALCVAMLVIVTSIRFAQRPSVWLWAGYPLAAVALITVLDLATSDSSVTAQIYYFFPVLYAGAQLRRHATVAICLLAIGGEATVNLALLPASAATVNLSFVGTALATSALLLVHSGEHTDELIARLERRAAIDPLTGLLSRRVLDEAVNSALDSAAADDGTALLVLDVDHFKSINDRHGHPTGDAVLQELATLLLGLHRRGDLMSRLGGDEIAVLMPGCSLAAALARAEEILFEVRAHIFDVDAHGRQSGPDEAAVPHVSVSIGVAHLPTHARDLRALYAAADAALYEAKRLVRDRVSGPRAVADPVG